MPAISSVKRMQRVQWMQRVMSVAMRGPRFSSSTERLRSLKRVLAGAARREELTLLLDVANHIEGHTICAFGDASAWPVQSFLRHYRQEFEYMIDHGGRSLVTDTLGQAA